MLKEDLLRVMLSDKGDPKVVFIGDDEQKKKAENVLNALLQDQLWRALTRLIQILEPLAIAANTIQGSFVCLDTVLFCFGFLLMQYRIALVEEHASFPGSAGIEAIISSVRRRWAKTDQEAFVACALMNPEWGFEPFNTRGLPFFRLHTLSEFLCRVYCRIFSVDQAPEEFRDELHNYLHGRGMYEGLKHEVEEEKCRAMKKVHDNTTFDYVHSNTFCSQPALIQWWSMECSNPLEMILLFSDLLPPFLTSLVIPHHVNVYSVSMATFSPNCRIVLGCQCWRHLPRSRCTYERRLLVQGRNNSGFNGHLMLLLLQGPKQQRPQDKLKVHSLLHYCLFTQSPVSQV